MAIYVNGNGRVFYNALASVCLNGWAGSFAYEVRGNMLMYFFSMYRIFMIVSIFLLCCMISLYFQETFDLARLFHNKFAMAASALCVLTLVVIGAFSMACLKPAEVKLSDMKCKRRESAVIYLYMMAISSTIILGYLPMIGVNPILAICFISIMLAVFCAGARGILHLFRYQ